jgi:Protein of unknown function (DUF4230)
MTFGSNGQRAGQTAIGQLRRRTAALLVGAAVLVLGCYGYQQVSDRLWAPAAATVEVRTLISGQLQNMTELTTAKMSSKATVVVSQARKFGDFSLGDTNLVYEGVGDVQAGIDLMQLQAKQVDPAQGRIHILLPPPQITNVGLNVQRSSVLANYKRWFGPNVELELQDQAQREALKQIRAAACNQQLIDMTNANAKQLVERILQTAGYQEVIIETQTPQPNTCLKLAA